MGNKTRIFPKNYSNMLKHRSQFIQCSLRSNSVNISTIIVAFMNYGNNIFLKMKKKFCVLRKEQNRTGKWLWCITFWSVLSIIKFNFFVILRNNLQFSNDSISCENKVKSPYYFSDNQHKANCLKFFLKNIKILNRYCVIWMRILSSYFSLLFRLFT